MGSTTLLDCISEEFALDKGIAFCNHGSFGAVPRSVHMNDLRHVTQMEQNPDLWMRRTSPNVWHENRRAIAKYLGSNPTNLAFVVNTTYGANAVLSSMAWNAGDVIICSNIQYGSVRRASDDVVLRRKGVEVFEVQIPYPLESEEQVIEVYQAALETITASGKNPRLAFIDAISSMPAILLPFEKLTKVLKAKGVDVFIDGAHAPGQIELNLEELGADYFAGNLHKWFFVPKTVAVFWVAPKHQASLRGPIVSFDYCRDHPRYFTDPLAGNFFWQGTSNNTAVATVSSAIDWIEKRLGGLESYREAIRKIALQARELIEKSWGGPISHFEIPDHMIAPFMFNVMGPECLGEADPTADSEELMFELFDKFKVWVAVGKWQGRWFFRVSCNVYNTLEDFQKVADAVKSLRC